MDNLVISYTSEITPQRHHAVVLDAWLLDGNAEVHRKDNVITIRTKDATAMADHMVVYGHIDPVVDDHTITPA